MSAGAVFQAQKGEHVVGREKSSVWLIKEHDSEGKYTIATANDKLRWWLDDDLPDTPITLNDAPPSDPRCHWTFQRISRVKAKDEAREHEATLRSYFNMMSQLSIDHYTITEASDNKKPRLNQALLFRAAERGHDGAVRLILAQGGVDVNFRDKFGRTPLHFASQNGHDAVVRLFLARNDVDVNSRYTDGMTPLHVGHNAVVRLLLAQDGVDVDLKDNTGRTPLMWAKENKHKIVAQLLQEKIG